MKLLSVIIPCYNESKCLKHNIEDIVIPYFNNLNIDYEIILVNDGSSDNTKEIMKEIKGVISVSYDDNHGKGYAIRQGILASKGEYILFMDTDLSTDLSAVHTVLENINKYDFIVGSRHLKDSVIPQKQPPIRQFIGWVCRKLVNISFGFHLKDTQCGFKAIKGDIAREMSLKTIVDRFAFDVEYLYYAKLHKYSILEIPVTWINDESSTVKIGKSSIEFLKDMTRIKENKKHYLEKITND